MGEFWGMMGWKGRKERNFGEERGRRGGRTDMESNRVGMLLGSEPSYYDDLVLKSS